MDIIKFKPIGYVKSPHKNVRGLLYNLMVQKNMKVTLKLRKNLLRVKRLEAFSHIIVIYHLHEVHDVKLVCRPFMDDVEHGIFAIRGPNRPNPIGLSIVPLKCIEDNKVWIKKY